MIRQNCDLTTAAILCACVVYGEWCVWCGVVYGVCGVSGQFYNKVLYQLILFLQGTVLHYSVLDVKFSVNNKLRNSCIYNTDFIHSGQIKC